MIKDIVARAAEKGDHAFVDAFLYSYYTRTVAEVMTEKFGIEPLTAIRRFMYSETYRMLITPKLEMFEFSPYAISDIWESEQITGNPRDSVYIRCD